MYDSITQFEPLLPSGHNELQDLAWDIIARSAALSSQLHPITQQPIIELLRLINSYYSNLIEGRSTHPIDIERAMRKVYADDPAKRDLQMESLAHINLKTAVKRAKMV